MPEPKTVVNEQASRATRVAKLNQISLFVGLIVCAIPAIAYLAGRLTNAFVVNSDHLLLPEMLDDLVHGGSLDRWIVPYATFLVPDWPLYSFALLVTPSPTLAVALFAFIQTALLFGALRRIARSFDASNQNTLALVGLSIVVAYTINNALPLVYIATAYTHFGTAILVLWAIALTLEWIKGPTSKLVGANLIISGAAVMSDRLFILWFLIPAATSLGLLAVSRRVTYQNAARWIGSHVVVSVLALPISGLLFSQRSEYDLTLGFGQTRASIARLKDTVSLIFDYSTTLIPVIIVAGLIVAWCLLRRTSLVGGRLDPALADFLIVFFVVCASVTLLAQIMMSGDVAPAPRYSLPLLIVPLVLVPILTLAGWRWSWSGRSSVSVLAALPVLLVLGNLITFVGDIDPDRSPVPSACISSALTGSGSTNGIASYWDARTVEIFSEGQLQVAPYDALLYEAHVNAGLDGFADQYDFAVTSDIYPGWSLPLPLLEYIAGTPVNQVECGEWTVTDWGPGGLELATFSTVGDTITFDGCIMSSHLAEPTDSCQLAVDNTNTTRDFLVYGPYSHISPGVYDVTATYASVQPSTSAVGEWDMALLGLPPEDVLASGQLAGTDGATTSFTTRVVVPAGDRPTSLFEWRLVTDGGVDVSFSSVTITRVG